MYQLGLSVFLLVNKLLWNFILKIPSHTEASSNTSKQHMLPVILLRAIHVYVSTWAYTFKLVIKVTYPYIREIIPCKINILLHYILYTIDHFEETDCNMYLLYTWWIRVQWETMKKKIMTKITVQNAVVTKQMTVTH